ncbi:helix-turn-helix domain-containing protein [Bradyrhizobium betae]
MKEKAPVRLRGRNRLRTRQELLHTALDLFEARGLAACSVDAVARQAGASKTTAYTYFPGGIDDILRDQYCIIGERVRLRGEQMRNSSTTAEDRIVALMGGIARDLRRTEGGALLYDAHTGPQPAARAGCRRDVRSFSQNDRG